MDAVTTSCERARLAKEAFDAVKRCAEADQLLTHERFFGANYSLALDALDLERTGAEASARAAPFKTDILRRRRLNMARALSNLDPTQPRTEEPMTENTTPPAEETLAAQEAALRAELKRHDWYYHYSDDGRVFRAGTNHRNQIDALFKAFKDKVGHAKAHAVWNEMAPKDMQIVEKGEAS